MSGSSHVYELIIAGGGPAGVTATIYAARKKMDFLVVTTNIGGQVSYSSEIENYTGFQFITGEELSAKLEQHLEKFKFEMKMEEVEKVEKDGNLFRVRTDSGEYQARTVIIATGRKPRELGVPGEAEFKNRGITYCATCDAPLFEGMDVAVVGGGNSGLEATLQLMKLARSVRVIHNGPQLKADPVYIDKAKESGKVEFLTDTKVLQVTGDKLVKGIKVQRKGKEEMLSVQGIFVEIGSTPNSHIVDFVDKNQWGEIIVNAKCETNVVGLFAAGDVTNVPEKQIIVAAGEGCKAALTAFRFLSQV
nr:FAD-dependent oxidoreductase [Candidatus Njordarchaeum guaymaensis]